MDIKVIREQKKTFKDLKWLEVFIFEKQQYNKVYGCCIYLDNNQFFSLNMLEKLTKIKINYPGIEVEDLEIHVIQV